MRNNRKIRTIHRLTLAGQLMAAAFLGTACTEEIDLDLNSSQQQLVVDGSLSNEYITQYIKLSASTGYFYTAAPPVVKEAVITLTDGTAVYKYTEYSPGNYRTTAKVSGVIGRTYSLHIKIPFTIQGKSEFDATGVIKPVHVIDSVGLVFHPEKGVQGYWEVKLYALDPPSADYYRFLLYKNHKLISRSLSGWFVTDDRFFNGNYTNGGTVGWLNQNSLDQTVKEGDTVTLEVNGIGKDYAEFIWAAQAEADDYNPLFSGQPANVKGNISNGAAGFFAMYSLARHDVIVPKR
jgi:hypothetical protein